MARECQYSNYARAILETKLPSGRTIEEAVEKDPKECCIYDARKESTEGFKPAPSFRYQGTVVNLLKQPKWDKMMS